MLRNAILLLCLVVGIRADDLQESSTSPKIVIVGAGSAGIAAATRLLQNGFENVILLEAGDRIGGRVYTTELEDSVVDLGAQWVHGEKSNVAFEMAYPLDLLERPTVELPYAKLYTAPGVQLDQEITDDIKQVYDRELDVASNFSDGVEGSVGDYLEKQFKDYFEKHPEINETMQKELLWHYNLLQTGLDGSDTWYDAAAAHYSNYHDCEGSTIVNWKERGYSTILDVLMKKIPNPAEELPLLAKTKLNAEVTKVDYSSDDGKVKVTTQDGTEYIADHVIMTPSLGVMKAEYETLFEPALSDSKINSIKGLGFGNAAKIWLAFNEPWWNDALDSVAAFSFLWTENDRKEVENDPESKWILSVAATVFIPHKPHVLLLWVSGEGAMLADKVPDELMLNQTMHMLNKYLSDDYNVTNPVAMKRSQWSTDKHFRGTYSFRSLESERVNATPEALSEPIIKEGKPIVLFAGEATNPIHFSTVHGAIETGWREADRIMQYHNIADAEKEGEKEAADN